MFYLYLPFGLSGVTRYYVDIIADSIKLLGHEIKTVDTIKKIPPKSNIVTISDKDSTYVIARRNPNFIITWFQGVAPEEMDIIYNGRWDRILRILIHRFFERYVLKHGSLNLFVSNAMKEHYSSKYKYKGANNFIMPCFGNSLDRDAFNDQRYCKPRFLYSGSIAKWQCVDEMLILFKKIKSELPEATLSILTPDQDLVKELLERHKVEASVDFISPDKLQSYIRQFKYGFIVRDDIIMNRVATPTKMSNYMGAGIIPVYSDVVLDYKQNITSKTPYVVAFTNFDDCVTKIKAIESSVLSPDLISQSYAEIFQVYWNRDYYVMNLKQAIEESMTI